ncbi:AEC family transporter [Oceanomicrobium pacificus]|uniref:AEC family transporter n=1 Tax=Oceanomicrobium pacificus TaxID=2692916 RepID=A0A6B0TWX8_9RHOB|nr:AEC family transporter [Oceanomicrobium pacificus]MXU65664.1 AEC family transporter [Oceanomicrobium pacificus]
MLTLLNVVIPVFLVIGAGYLATRLGLFKQSAVDGLMVFTQGFALPCLLFDAIARLDLKTAFEPGLLISFYSGAILCFALGILGARTIFRRRPGEAVAIGFGALFSNSVLLGLPIMERAYGPGSLDGNFAIIAFHAPVCYLIGITVMEVSRVDGRGFLGTMRAVGATLFRNALTLGLMAGFIVNLSGISLPDPVWSAVDMMIEAALPAALFGLGGILTRYALRRSIGEAAMVSTLSLVVHPLVTYLLADRVFGLSDALVRSAVVTASMAPGVNAYVFANIYGRAKGAAASTVLLATAASVFTVWIWLAILP